MDPVRKALETAAQPTLERIRADRGNVPTLIQPLLDYLLEHLFDPDLDVNSLRRACGIRDNSLPVYFHDAIGAPPFAYIEDCRMEVSARLVARTRLKLWQIAQIVGYSTLPVFSRAFLRWSAGVRPSQYRRDARRARLAGREIAVPRAVEILPVRAGNGKSPGIEAVEQLARETAEDLRLFAALQQETLVKALDGHLEPDEADELARILVKLYPKSFGAQAAAEERDREEGRRLSPEEAWTLLENRSANQRRNLFEGGARLASVELYQMLHEKARTEGRKDRKKGAELFELAAECAKACVDLDEIAYGELVAQAWAWVGNAQRLALDFSAAEEAFAEALAALPEGCDPLIHADVLDLKACLRKWQRRFDEALALSDQAVALCDRIAPASLSERQLKSIAEIITGRADLNYSVGEFAAAVSDLTRVVELSDRLGDLYLRFVANQQITNAFTKLEDYEQAARYFVTAEKLAKELDLASMSSHLCWTAGIIARGLGQLDLAEEKFIQARLGLSRSEELYTRAVISLDLALLYSEQGRSADVMRLTVEMIPVFEALKVNRDALVALQILQTAVAEGNIAFATLQQIKSSLEHFRRADP